jgi:hypothetical protein
MKRVLLFLLSLLLVQNAFAQFSLEPYFGYQKDINNSRYHFSQVNTGLQFSYALSKSSDLLLQIQASWPNTTNRTDSLFTTNPALPLYFTADNTIKPRSWYFGIGQRFNLKEWQHKHTLYGVYYTGINLQKITVHHPQAKDDYTILNPDQSSQKTGPYLSGGIGYKRSITGGQLLAQLTLSTEPLGKDGPAYATYNFLAPLALNVIYSIKL